MDSQLIIIITRLITPFFISLWIFFLLDFKEPRHVIRPLYFILIAILLLINGIILFSDNGNAIYSQHWPLTFTLPFIIMTLLTTERKPFYSLFTILTALFCGCVVSFAGIFFSEIIDALWLDPIIRTALFIMMLPLINAYKSTYRITVGIVKRGWFVLTLIPLLLIGCFYIFLNIRTYPDHSILHILAFMIIAFGAAVYGFLYLFFRRLLADQVHSQYSEMLNAQAEALEKNARTSSYADQRLSILRHDLKHYMSMISIQMESGHPDAALVIIQDAKVKFDDIFDTIEVVSYHKLLQVLFNLLTVMYIACFSVLTGDIAFLLTGKAAYQLMTHILCLSTGLILILRLRSPFLKASELLRKGWGALCCVPLTIVLICLLCISRVTYHGELIFSLIAYTSLAAGACVYYMIYRFFIKVLEEQQSAHFENLLKLRARSAEEDIRISEESKSTISHYRSVISSFMQDLEDDVSSGLDINESLKQHIRASDLQERPDSRQDNQHLQWQCGL